MRETLVFPSFTDQRNTELAGVLLAGNVVSVHVRRGDYLGDPVLEGICDEGYYQRALDYMEQQIRSPRFVFFSNDILWCRSRFGMRNALFVDWNTGLNSFRDMQLMSLCEHHIIANSSFSWWGAWLNNQPDKIVISPDRWVTMEGIDLSGIILPTFRVC